VCGLEVQAEDLLEEEAAVPGEAAPGFPVPRVLETAAETEGLAWEKSPRGLAREEGEAATGVPVLPEEAPVFEERAEAFVEAEGAAQGVPELQEVAPVFGEQAEAFGEPVEAAPVFEERGEAFGEPALLPEKEFRAAP